MDRPTFVAVGVGLIIGFVFAVALVAPLEITPERAWALTGSALGAALAVGGSMLVFRAEQREKETGDRRRIHRQLGSVLALVPSFEAEANKDAPDEAALREKIKKMVRSSE